VPPFLPHTHNPGAVEFKPPAVGKGPPVALSTVRVIPPLGNENEACVAGDEVPLRFGKVSVIGAAEAEPATTAFAKTIPTAACVRDFLEIMWLVGRYY
jgi:hypothetical protein